MHDLPSNLIIPDGAKTFGLSPTGHRKEYRIYALDGNPRASIGTMGALVKTALRPEAYRGLIDDGSWADGRSMLNYGARIRNTQVTNSEIAHSTVHDSFIEHSNIDGCHIHNAIIRETCAERSNLLGDFINSTLRYCATGENASYYCENSTLYYCHSGDETCEVRNASARGVNLTGANLHAPEDILQISGLYQDYTLAFFKNQAGELSISYNRRIISEATYRDLCGHIHPLVWPNKNLRVEYLELAKRHLGLA